MKRQPIQHQTVENILNSRVFVLHHLYQRGRFINVVDGNIFEIMDESTSTPTSYISFFIEDDFKKCATLYSYRIEKIIKRVLAASGSYDSLVHIDKDVHIQECVKKIVLPAAREEKRRMEETTKEETTTKRQRK